MMNLKVLRIRIATGLLLSLFFIFWGWISNNKPFIPHLYSEYGFMNEPFSWNMSQIGVFILVALPIGRVISLLISYIERKEYGLAFFSLMTTLGLLLGLILPRL